MLNTKTSIALTLAEGICPGCACSNQHISSKDWFPYRAFSNQSPCPFFHPDNFYYDSNLQHFWCHNWVDAKGNTIPSVAVA